MSQVNKYKNIALRPNTFKIYNLRYTILRFKDSLVGVGGLMSGRADKLPWLSPPRALGRHVFCVFSASRPNLLYILRYSFANS